MKAKALRELSSEDLIAKEKNLKKELFDLNYQRKLGTVEKPSSFRLLKRDIARSLTILKERKLNDRNKNTNK